MTIEENIDFINKKIPEGIKLIAVTKTRTIEEMQKAYNTGIRDFGENKVQELIKKYDAFPADVKWHLIGHLQKNKVKYIVGKVELVHSLDSIDLLNEIEKLYTRQNKICNALIQINIGKEESKTGIYTEELEDMLNACENCNSVKIKGLMAIIPQGDENSCRKYFHEMRQIFDKLKLRKMKNISMDILSMGMTSDYQWAIEEGSNTIRIGEGIFGKRIYNNKNKEDIKNGR